MGIIFMNSKNSNTSHPHILLLNLSDKLYFKRSDKYVAVSNLSIYVGKYKKSHTKTINWTSIEWKVWITRWIIYSDIQDYFKYIIKKTWNIYW